MKQNPEFKMSHTEQRLVRIKMARHMLNMHELDKEIRRYDYKALQKSAAVGARHGRRVKYAALQMQYAIEKRAFLGALAGLAGKGLMAGGKAALGAGRAAAPHVGKAMGAGAKAVGTGAMNAGKGIANVAGGAAKGGLSAAKRTYGLGAGAGEGLGSTLKTLARPQSQGNAVWRAAGLPFKASPAKSRMTAMQNFGTLLGDTASAGLTGARRGATQAAKANPMQAMMGAGAIGAGVGTQLPAAYQGVQDFGNNTVQGVQDFGNNLMQSFNNTTQQVGDTANAANEGIGRFFNNIGQAGQDIYGGFQQAGNRF